ncbi:MAG TPA: hypothetical protein VGE45_03605 [Chloroflexia bacterium]|jgi:hypothetical protein
MSDPVIMDLMQRAAFSFVGTIEHLGAGTMSNVPIGERTAVVRVDYVLHAPPAFTGLDGQRITIELSADNDLPAVGDASAFFAQGVAFGESIVVAEVGRLPVNAVMGHAGLAIGAGEPTAFASLEREADTQRLREHKDNADAVILGRTAKLERVSGPVTSEHDPDWWKATLDVYHVEKGDVPGDQVETLYINSIDVRWRTAPKPKASQGGLWLLHATEGDLRAYAPFALLHPEDFQPTQELEDLRG